MDYSPSILRRRSSGFIPGLVRVDRAVDFIIQEILRTSLYLEGLKTKTLGESEYQLYRLADAILPICAMSGDYFLSERVAYTMTKIRRLSSRASRLDTIQTLRELLSEIEAYGPSILAGDPDGLLDEQTSEAGKKTSPDDLAKEGSLFVIMPFSQDFNDVWKGGIQAASKATGFHPIRVDTINRSSNITDDIVTSIKNCRIAVVDVTGNNANVMFELGYVMALEKPYIVISQSVEFLPFDIRNIRTLVYTNSWSGIEELRGKLNDFLKEFSTHKTGTRTRKTSK